MSPATVSAIGSFVETLIAIGIQDGPTIAAFISHAFAGTDPWTALAEERVLGILPGLKLEAAERAARIRATVMP